MIAVTGVFMRTSNDEIWETIGVTVHRIGLFILLLGFLGIFVLIQRGLAERYAKAFQWEFHDGVLQVFSTSLTDIVQLDLDDLTTSQSLDLDRARWSRARMLSLRGGRLSEALINTLVAAKGIIVLELSGVAIEEKTWDVLDSFDQLELLVLPESSIQSDIDRLQRGLPEVKILRHPVEIKPVEVFMRPA